MHPTIGVDFVLLTQKLRTIIVDGKKCKLQVWDFSGAERFRRSWRTIYKKLDGVIVMYDTGNRESFDRVEYWVREIVEEAPQTSLLLVGNKSDLRGERTVGTDEGQQLADKLRIPFVEMSAKTGENVLTAFERFTEEFRRRVMREAEEAGEIRHCRVSIDANTGTEGL